MNNINEFTLRNQDKLSNIPVSDSNKYVHKMSNTQYQQQQHKNSIPIRSSEYFWEDLYSQCQQTNKKLIEKFKILKSSVELFKQSLSLKNKQLIEVESHIVASNKKLQNLSSKIKWDQQLLKRMAIKCHEVKQQIQVTRAKVRKQQSVIVEEQKHYDEISLKIQRINKETQELKKQLVYKQQKQEQYMQLVEENRSLMNKFTQLKRQLSLAEIKQQKQLRDQSILIKKIDQLKTVVNSRQATNKQLRKQLARLKKYDAHNQDDYDNLQSKASIGQVTQNINEMEADYGHLQQQIMSLNYKIQQTNQKISQKNNSIRYMEDKKRQYQLLNEQNDRMISKQNQKGSLSPMQPKDTFSKKQGKTYRVIQSEQDQYFSYPKISMPQNNSQDYASHTQPQNTHEQQNNASRNQNPSTAKNGVKMTPNIDRIIDRFSKLNTKIRSHPSENQPN